MDKEYAMKQTRAALQYRGPEYDGMGDAILRQLAAEFQCLADRNHPIFENEFKDDREAFKRFRAERFEFIEQLLHLYRQQVIYDVECNT
jgi:hypothetical protein